MRGRHPGRVALVEQLDERLGIAERPDRRAATDRDRIRHQTVGNELIGDGLTGDFELTPVALFCAGEVQLRSEQHGQQLVAGGGVGTIAGEHEVRLEPEASTSGCGHPTVVRLRGANRDQRTGAGRNGLAAEELELARLVPAAAETREVISLHPESTAAGKGRAGFERRRQGGERSSFEMIEHDTHGRQCG